MISGRSFILFTLLVLSGASLVTIPRQVGGADDTTNKTSLPRWDLVGLIYLAPSSPDRPLTIPDKPPNSWWTTEFDLFKLQKQTDFTLITEILGWGATKALAIYFPHFLADQNLGTKYLDRLDEVVRFFASRGIRVLLFFGRPDLDSQSREVDPVLDLSVRRQLLSNIERILRYGGLRTFVSDVTLYWMAANTAATRTPEQILAYNREIKGVVNGAGKKFYVHVDGTWWDLNLNQNGYTPESVSPKNEASDGLFAESWAQGSLHSGLSKIIPKYFEASQVWMVADVPNGDLSPTTPNSTGSVQGDMNYWFKVIADHGIRSWFVWAYSDAGREQTPYYGCIYPDATHLTLKGELTKRSASLPTIAFGPHPQRVYLLVSSSVYEPLKDRLERWIQDVEKTGFEVIQKIITNETASDIRTLLRGTPDLAGCLMVGDIPYMMYETTYEYPEGVPHYETFPTDLYYMDLDGVWVDADKDGFFEAHKGNITPEIWVGRLKASTLSGSDEVGLLKNYFDKNHLYRIGALTLPHRALIYTDHYLDYYTNVLTPETASALRSVYDEVLTVAYPQTTSASDYLQHLTQGYSIVRLLVHSGGFGHYFGNQTDGKVYPRDIKVLDPKVFFYIITSCGNFDYHQRDYIGGWYVFAESYSLLAIGDSGVHDLFVVLPKAFFPRLQNEYFGLAYLHYLRKCVAENARVDSVHNAIMIGDPLLKVAYNGPDADLDGLSDQYEVAIGTDVTRPDSDGDGLTDYRELKLGTNPMNADSDGDYVKDYVDLNPLDPMPENAFNLIGDAEKAVRIAEREGRTQGLDMARQILAAAQSAYDSSQYDTAISLAKEALELAEKATVPKITTSSTTATATLPTQPNWFQTNWSYVAVLATITAIAVILVARRSRRKGG